MSVANNPVSCNNSELQLSKARISLGAGNLVPHWWYSVITAGGGKPDFISITILSELWYLYRKTASAEIAKSYSYYENKFNLTRSQLQDATLRLHNSGLVHRSFRTVLVRGRKFPNELHLEINLEKLLELRETYDKSVQDHSDSTDGEISSGHMLGNTGEHHAEISEEHISNKEISKRKNRLEESTFSKASSRNSGEGRGLESFYPLSAEDCKKLQQRSGRDFTPRAINEILLKLSKIRQKHKFANKTAFIHYMSAVLKHEMRDEATTSNETFKLSCNVDLKERKCEAYLESIERNQNTSCFWQLKRKLASVFSPKTAYELLSKLRFINIDHSRAQLRLLGEVSLSDLQIRLLLGQMQTVYGEHISSVEFILDGSTQNSEREDDISQQYEGIWGRLRLKIMNYLGMDGKAIDQHWFSKLEANIDKQERTLYLKAPSAFVKDWIQNNYRHLMERYIRQEQYSVALI